MVISVTVTGEVDKDKVVYRNGAKVTDLICVSGDLGAAYMGLQVLEREKQVFMVDQAMQPDLDSKDYIIRRQLKPEARIDVIKALAKLEITPTSMIDISDGLASELFHICSQSEVGVHIYEERMPIDNQTFETAKEFDLSPLTAMLNGGEDYELLFTVPVAQHDQLRNNPDISIIGYVKPADDGLFVETRGGTLAEIKAQGWNHFSRG